MQRDVSLGKQGRSQKKEKNFKDPSLFKASPTPKLILIKKGTAAGGGAAGRRETPSALPASDVEWCVLFFLIPRNFKINILNVLMRYACLLT